jgi:hypothetical protein
MTEEVKPNARLERLNKRKISASDKLRLLAKMEVRVWPMIPVRSAFWLACAMVLVGSGCSTHRPVSAVFPMNRLTNALDLRSSEQVFKVWDVENDVFKGHALTAGDGFVIYWSVATPSRLFVTDTQWEDHLSIQINGPLREGSWDVHSGAVTAVYSSGGGSDTETRPECAGVATAGTVRVMKADARKVTVALDLNLEVVQVPYRKRPLCRSFPLTLEFSAKVIK